EDLEEQLVRVLHEPREGIQQPAEDVAEPRDELVGPPAQRDPREEEVEETQSDVVHRSTPFVPLVDASEARSPDPSSSVSPSPAAAAAMPGLGSRASASSWEGSSASCG